MLTCAITGSNGVLGSKLAEVFLGLGSKLILIDKKIRKTSNKYIKTLSIDFTKPTLLEKILIKEKKIFNNIDFIINNAGYTGSNINWIKPLNFQTYKDWRSAHRVNLDCVFIISKIFTTELPVTSNE